MALNVLLVVSDSLRPDYLGCYGNQWIKTPNIDQLAGQGILFKEFHAASFPTGPMRRDLHSGRFTFPFTSWSDPWEPQHEVLAEILSHSGYDTCMVTDTPANRQYSAGFEHFEMIPGQSGQGIEPDPTLELRLPADPRKLRIPLDRLRRIARVESAWRGEEDRFVALTMRAAARWLEGRHLKTKPFFLCVDTFDPHEPWDPPRYYIDAYDPGYEGDELFEPAYEPAGYASESEIRHMRFMYAGEVSMVDRWIGYVLQTLDLTGMIDDTCVVLTSDHGFYHGEHGFIGKVQLDREGRIVRRWPLYATISRAPLILSIPGYRARTVDSFCQPPDIMPTLLDLAEIPIPVGVQGRTLLADISQDIEGPVCAVSSHTYRQDDLVRCPTSYRTRDYLYIYGGDEWRTEYYDLRKDPEESENLIHEREEEARTAHADLLEFLERVGCPATSLAMRKQFSPEPRANLPLQRIL